MAKIDYDAIRNQLNMPNLTDAAVRSVLASKGITTQADAQKWAQQNAAQADQGFLAKGFGALEQHWKKSEKPVSGLVDWLTSSLHKPSDAKKDPAAAAKPAAAAAPSGPTALQAQQYAVANSPWTQASQVLTSGMNADIQALSGLASGSALGAVDQNTDKMAGALTGTPASSGAGQWLAAQSAAANAATAPVAAAMQGEQNSFTTGLKPFTQSLLNQGQASALAVETAPQAGWYNALQTHIASNLNYYGSVPAAAKATFQNDPALAQAMVQSGGYGGGGTGTGLIPVTSLAPGGGGGASNALANPAGTVSTANLANPPTSGAPTA